MARHRHGARRPGARLGAPAAPRRLSNAARRRAPGRDAAGFVVSTALTAAPREAIGRDLTAFVGAALVSAPAGEARSCFHKRARGPIGRPSAGGAETSAAPTDAV